MSQRRLIYRNWIADLGCGPDDDRHVEQWPDDRAQLVRAAVSEALAGLTEDEREFVERYYYMGQTYGQISELSGRAIYKLEALNRRAIVRLRRKLGPLIRKLYGVEKEQADDCPICRSGCRAEIDRIIENKPKSEPWGPTMRRIRFEFGLDLRSPQRLIGHVKYH
jgi:hypothetical protein